MRTPTSTTPPLTLVLSVAIISATVLGFEVALTRVFSVLLRYHFGFLVISIALCGLGVGGYAAYWLRRRTALSLPLLALLFALSIDLALAVMLRGVFAYMPEEFRLTALILLVPFSIAGAFLAEVFSRYPAWSGRLYAWDLTGAACAAVGVILVLQVCGGIDACLALAVLAAIGAIVLPAAPAEAEPAPRRGPDPVGLVSAATAFVLLLLLLANKRLRWLDIPPIPPSFDADRQSLADRNITQPLFTELGTPRHTSHIVDTRWNAFARTDVVADAVDPGSYLIYTNGNVPTNMMSWNGDVSSIGRIAADFPLSDWAFAVAPLGAASAHQGKVLSIGPGGGLDALLALYHGAEDFDGAEINPSIVGIMHDYKSYNGGIYERAGVHVVTVEGRAFVREAAARGRRYGLIYSALTKTATAAQGMALLESYIHTSDAFSDYLRALDDDGQVTMVVDNPLLMTRFWVTAVAVLKAQGLDERTASRHVAMVYDSRRRGPYVYALVVQKSLITRTQSFQMMDAALQHGLTPIWIPDQAARADVGAGDPLPVSELATGVWKLDQFIQWFRDSQMDVGPCPDNRPFVLDLSLTVLPVFKQLTAVVLLLAVVLAALGSRDAMGRDALGSPTTVPMNALWLVYFLALGIGFMLVEIPLSQKLILPLGYPVLALTVILFSILLGGGLGSWSSQRVCEDQLAAWAASCAGGVALVTVGAALVLQGLGNAMLLMSLPWRCIVVAALLVPLGFLLGTPFPSGLRLLARWRGDQVPLIWGLNGVASVVGSLCAAMAAKAWGFNTVLVLGAAVYLLAALLLKQCARWQPLPPPNAPACIVVGEDAEKTQERAAPVAAGS